MIVDLVTISDTERSMQRAMCSNVTIAGKRTEMRKVICGLLIRAIILSNVACAAS